MSDIEEQYEQSLISVSCPGCATGTGVVTRELRRNPHFTCPACGCEQQVEVDKLVKIYTQFFEQVEEVKRKRSGEVEKVIFPSYVYDDDSETEPVN